MFKKLITIISISSMSFASVDVISKNQFFIKDKIELIKYPFIVASLNSNGSGFAYAINATGQLIFKSPISGGSKYSKTPYGLFHVNYKKQFHMSSKYPNLNGINNMDDMLNITSDGIALHKGNVNFTSHGCIHIDPKFSKKFYTFGRKQMPVIITSDKYSLFLRGY